MRNHRAMKWVEGAKQGIIVAGGQGKGNGLTQLSYPRWSRCRSIGHCLYG